MNEIIQVRMERLVYGGEALGRLPDKRAVFIPYALPGELVRAQIVEDKRSHARAELLSVVEPAPERIAPRCPHFGLCGGCHYQNLSYPDQLKAKTAILVDQLERIGGLKNIPLQPIVPSPQPFNYRNHVQFHLDPEGRLGYQAARSSQVISVEECHLPDASINEVWRKIDLEPIPTLERIGLRSSQDQDVQIIFESSDPEPFEFDVEDLPISAVHVGPGGSIVLAGSEQVIIEVLGRPFQVSAASFFQVNTAQAGAMVEHILQALPIRAESTVLDVYSGAGLFSAFLAPRCKRLVAIESAESSCADFAVNLDEFENVELYQAAAEEVLPYVQFQPQVIVVDPPRSGLDVAALNGLLDQKAEWLAYVSCDPATLARDARRLLAGGYQLVSMTPFDLFPQTFHIESISIWKRS